MNNIKAKLENWDPFKLGNVPKYKKLVMLLLYIAVCAATFALILYIILELCSDRNSKLSKYDGRIKKWNKQDMSNKLGNITVGVSITPSENTMHNIIKMNYYTEGLLKEKKLKSSYKYNEGFFFYNNTKLYFPIFRFIYDEIPIGDSEPSCVHLSWADRRFRDTLNLYDDVGNFQLCSNADNPKIVWRNHDSKTGANIHAIKQTMREMTGCNTKEDCQKKCDKYKGIAKKTYSDNYMCYSYKILTDICLRIKENDKSWMYDGGCFEGDSASRMIDAVPGKTYKFESIRIQVRSSLDPFLVATEEGSVNDDFSFGVDIDFMYTITFLIMFVAIIIGVIVAAAVLLREPISKTSYYAKFFKEPSLPS